MGKYILARQKNKIKWTSFIHNGVMFPEPYKKHNIPITYNNNNEIILNELAEEYATYYTRYFDTEYIKNKIFNKNFWKDWKKLLKTENEKKIENLENCDFSKIYDYLINEKTKKQELTKEQKQTIKDENDKKSEKYKFATVDGNKQPVGNYIMEPPGIFIGRGCHPMLGRIKKRILPKDITLNLSKEAPIPELQDFYKDHKWGKIVHDNNAEWLASWKDSVLLKNKYVWLSAQSTFRSESDLQKFEQARELKKKINKIRKKNDLLLETGDLKIKQIATAVYFVDNFALRIGNEKGSDAADTVGVTSLRIEHIMLLPENKVKLDFLGKDSIRYTNKVIVSEQVYKNLQLFMLNKDKKQDLFDEITSNDVNKYLRKFMKGLTAKVFRTLNASYHFQKELKNISKKYDEYDKDDKINVILTEYDKANIKIAALCNHQKKASKTHNEQVEKINEKINNESKKLRKIQKSKGNNKKERIEKIKNNIKKLKSKKSLKIDQKNLSMGTSKINYIDPRITVAFSKKHNIPIEKFFTKTLLNKFHWALNVDQDFKF